MTSEEKRKPRVSIPVVTNWDDLEKAARCGEPSYVWRSGQERRLRMMLEAGGNQIKGRVLENGCGVGIYVKHLARYAGVIIGLEYDFERVKEAAHAIGSVRNASVMCAAGEKLPFPDGTFDMILSHEVLEHVKDDRLAVCEMVRVLPDGGLALIFVPNRGYPFETHGVYWRGRYHFGNIPLVNYLPKMIRNRMAPHVRVYSSGDLERLFSGLSVRIVRRMIIFGAYDNIIARKPTIGRFLRAFLQWLERTPLRIFGLSHFWVVEKVKFQEPRKII